MPVLVTGFIEELGTNSYIRSLRWQQFPDPLPGALPRARTRRRIRSRIRRLAAAVTL